MTFWVALVFARILSLRPPQRLRQRAESPAQPEGRKASRHQETRRGIQGLVVTNAQDIGGGAPSAASLLHMS